MHTNQYRLEREHLYKLNNAGDAYVLIAIVPRGINTLSAALAWYYQYDEYDDYE